jgi:hypothetical protein
MECIGEGTSRCGASARNASIATMAHGFDPCGHSAMKRASSAGVMDVCLSGEPEPVPVLERGRRTFWVGRVVITTREHRGFVPALNENITPPKPRLSENEPTLPENNPKTSGGAHIT